MNVVQMNADQKGAVVLSVGQSGEDLVGMDQQGVVRVGVVQVGVVRMGLVRVDVALMRLNLWNSCPVDVDQNVYREETVLLGHGGLEGRCALVNHSLQLLMAGEGQIGEALL